MFGAYFYGYVDRDEVKPYLQVSHVADKLDKNDFMFSNSPYSLMYEIPPTRGPIVVQSDSPPLPPMTLDSPPAAPISVRRGREDIESNVSAHAGLQGIDEFGTNTFQIHAWMAAATKAPAPALLDEHSLKESAQKEEDIETDSEFEKQREQEIEQVDEEDELEDPGVREESGRGGEEDDTDRRRADVADVQVPANNEKELDR